MAICYTPKSNFLTAPLLCDVEVDIDAHFLVNVLRILHRQKVSWNRTNYIAFNSFKMPSQYSNTEKLAVEKLTAEVYFYGWE